jgi:hypothetical protein
MRVFRGNTSQKWSDDPVWVIGRNAIFEGAISLPQGSWLVRVGPFSRQHATKAQPGGLKSSLLTPFALCVIALKKIIAVEID